MPWGLKKLPAYPRQKLCCRNLLMPGVETFENTRDTFGFFMKFFQPVDRNLSVASVCCSSRIYGRIFAQFEFAGKTISWLSPRCGKTCRPCLLNLLIAQSTAKASRRNYRRSRLDSGWRGHRQNARHHLPRRPPHRKRRRAGKHSRRHVYQQGRARNAGARHETDRPRPQGCQRQIAPPDHLHLSFPLRADSAPAHRKTRLQTQLCYLQRIRTAWRH